MDYVAKKETRVKNAHDKSLKEGKKETIKAFQKYTILFHSTLLTSSRSRNITTDEQEENVFLGVVIGSDAEGWYFFLLGK